MKFDNVAIACIDLERSIAFYQDVFGFELGYRTHIEEANAEFQVMRRHDLNIELISQEGVMRSVDARLTPPFHVSVGRIIAICFSTDDLPGETARLAAKGVEFVWKNRTLSNDGLRSTLVRDPDGNMINVLCYPG